MSKPEPTLTNYILKNMHDTELYQLDSTNLTQNELELLKDEFDIRSISNASAQNADLAIRRVRKSDIAMDRKINIFQRALALEESRKNRSTITSGLRFDINRLQKKITQGN